MKNKKNNIIFSILFCVLIVMLFSNKIYAQDKEYKVNSADFYVELEENGDAIITEKWTVDFIYGNFSRFYKDIYKDVSNLETFSDIDILEVKINDVICEASNSLDRVNYHYFYEESNKTNTIHWFLDVANESVTYEITYKLKGVVKETDNNIALFCYRFIGANFPKVVEKTKVVIIPPHNTNIDVRFSDTSNIDIYEDKVVFLSENSDGVLKYNIAMNASIFNNLNYISQKTIKSDENKANIKNHIVLGIFLFIIIIIIRRISKAWRENVTYKRLINENPNYFKDLANNLESRNIHPLSIAFLSNKDIPILNVFKIILLDLCRRGKCYIDKGNIFITKNNNDLYSFEIKIISTMTDIINYQEDYNNYIFKFSDFCLFFSDESKKRSFIDFLKAIWSDFGNDMRTKLGSFSFLEKDLIFLNKYFKHKASIGTYEYFSLVERTHYIDYLTILSIIYLKPTKIELAVDNNYLYDFCDELDDLLFEELPSSSSSGSSCSSCSSCSGCGGGGAD